MKRYNSTSPSALPGYQPSHRPATLEADLWVPVSQGLAIGISCGSALALIVIIVTESVNALLYQFLPASLDHHLNYLVLPALITGIVFAIGTSAIAIIRFIADSRSLHWRQLHPGQPQSVSKPKVKQRAITVRALGQPQPDILLSDSIDSGSNSIDSGPDSDTDDQDTITLLDMRFLEFCQRVIRDNNIARRHCTRWNLLCKNPDPAHDSFRVSQGEWSEWQTWWKNANLLDNGKPRPGLTLNHVFHAFPHLSYLAPSPTGAADPQNALPSPNQPPNQPTNREGQDGT